MLSCTRTRLGHEDVQCRAGCWLGVIWAHDGVYRGSVTSGSLGFELVSRRSTSTSECVPIAARSIANALTCGAPDGRRLDDICGEEATSLDSIMHQALVIGSGPGGLATVASLLDHGLTDIAWVDDKWTGGRLNGMYREISS